MEGGCRGLEAVSGVWVASLVRNGDLQLSDSACSELHKVTAFYISSRLAQFERRLIQERTKAGLAAARARGRNGGRPKIEANDAKVVTAKKLHADESLEIDDICKTLRISRSTFYRDVRL